jgi:hypothetical protein
MRVKTLLFERRKGLRLSGMAGSGLATGVAGATAVKDGEAVAEGTAAKADVKAVVAEGTAVDAEGGVAIREQITPTETATLETSTLETAEREKYRPTRREERQTVKRIRTRMHQDTDRSFSQRRIGYDPSRVDSTASTEILSKAYPPPV